ncbi:MAG: hypothetical protein JOY62_17540 [Acidobacteriaceae bacterium]|nr:hypothetical protein [Acidobacteriaceae bacterium]MBV9781770.1 hypothetical protein [Acidobacteriaceae bacterium]
MSTRTSSSTTTSESPDTTQPARFMRWHRRVLGFGLVIFAFELGLFLLVFPWLRSWELSWVALRSPTYAAIWTSPYFRGALSGLGLLNIYIAFAELVRQLKSLFSADGKS